MPLRLVRNRVRLPVLPTTLVVWSRVEVMTVPDRARVDLRWCLVLCTRVEVCLNRIGSTPPNLESRLANLLWLIPITLGVNTSDPVLFSVVLSRLTTLHIAANLLWSPIAVGLLLAALCRLGTLPTNEG